MTVDEEVEQRMESARIISSTLALDYKTMVETAMRLAEEIGDPPRWVLGQILRCKAEERCNSDRIFGWFEDNEERIRRCIKRDIEYREFENKKQQALSKLNRDEIRLLGLDS